MALQQILFQYSQIQLRLDYKRLLRVQKIPGRYYTLVKNIF
jgi:hypothetical protein